MATTMDITPSPEARRLFSSMVARADGPGDRIVSLASTLALSVRRRQMGTLDSKEVRELQEQGWIAPDEDDGGWKIL
jgi:hypothetical protein